MAARWPGQLAKPLFFKGFMCLFSVLVGCAPAAPMLLGGSTTPRNRVDVGLGGAARVPVGDLAPREFASGDELLAFAEPGGIVPVLWARWGFLRDWQAGLFVTGSTARLELMGEASISPFMRLIAGIAPYGGYAISQGQGALSSGEGYRLGALAPLAIALNVGGIFEGWLGARLGVEHAEGTIAEARAGHLTAFRAGAFLGLSVGLPRVHVLAELAADYEYWRGALATLSIERQGLALTPGFALRIRF
jgi:hypothetical protein